MTTRDKTTSIECALTWQLARTHGWSDQTEVSELVSDANVTDEKQARKIARNNLPDRSFIGYHQGKDQIWLTAPPGDDLVEFLTERCGFTQLQVEATLDSYI